MHARGERLTILLVNPPYYRLFKSTYAYNKYPLSLGYLAGAIKKATDWDVTVYNADFACRSETWTVSYLSGTGFSNYRRNLRDPLFGVWKEVESVITESKPAVIGIYSCSANCVSASITAGIAKKIDRQVIVVVGGPHPTSVGREVLNDPNIDIIVKGEGEQTIVELLEKIGNNEPFDTVRGIIYKTGGQIVENANRELVKDLDSLCFPHIYAREVLRDYKKYPVSAFSTIIATRGCPYNCFFCGSRSVFGRKTRFRSVENVTSEIQSLQKMGIRWVAFLDDSFGLNKQYTRELCTALMKRCSKIQWECESRVDLIDEETIALMKRAGCREIHLGVESGNNQILEDMRKEITVEEAFSAAQIIRKHGLRLRANFLVGFPTETEQTLRDTFRTMKKFKDMMAYSIFTPYPGTEAFEYCQKMGLVKSNDDVSLYNHQSPENFFCLNLDRERFKEITSEMEGYVDRQNAIQDMRRILSLEVLGDVQNYGAFRSPRSFANLTREVLSQLRGMVRDLTHTS
jgi:radical SAM superfamily enzyme YgiQ (UPF0313 family)